MSQGHFEYRMLNAMANTMPCLVCDTLAGQKPRTTTLTVNNIHATVPDTRVHLCQAHMTRLVELLGPLEEEEQK